MATWEILLHERPSVRVESEEDLTARWLKHRRQRRPLRDWAATEAFVVETRSVAGVRRCDPKPRRQKPRIGF